MRGGKTEKGRRERQEDVRRERQEDVRRKTLDVKRLYF
jgi:hypothetical protein